jgi:hypothetical protein
MQARCRWFESVSVAALTQTHGGQSEVTGGIFRKDAEGLSLAIHAGLRTAYSQMQPFAL